ncbi:MAG: hypothetical protein AB1752_14175 [Candidatus Zixiibacteriota bacterium]
MTTIRRRFHADERGMTMIELLIAAFLTVLLGAFTMEFYVSQHKAWLVEVEVSDIQQNARAALDEIATHMRICGYHVGAHPAYASGADTVISYYQNDSTAHLDTVMFFVDAADSSRPMLMRRLNAGSAEPFAEFVESMRLTVLTPDLVELSLTARGEDPDDELIHGDGYRRRTLTSQVKIRNL